MAPPRDQLLIRLGYRGDRFYGVSPQPNLPTVHDALAARIQRATGCPPRVLTFAARTDRGVHARENLATCWLPLGAVTDAALADLQAPRPDGLHNVTATRVPPSTFARGLATAKAYTYVVETGWEGVKGYPLAWRIWPELCRDRMEAARAPLLGTHDFRAFAVRHKPTTPSVRTLTRVDMRCEPHGPGHRWVFSVEGDSFLRRMVRLLVGTLVECGAGVRDPAGVAAALASRDNAQVGRPAPPGGLTLSRVFTAPR